MASGADSFKIIFLFLNGFGILLACQRLRRDQVKPNLTQAPSPLCHTACTSVEFSLPTDISTASVHILQSKQLWFIRHLWMPFSFAQIPASHNRNDCSGSAKPVSPHCKMCLAWLFKISLFCHLFPALDLNLITVSARKRQQSVERRRHAWWSRHSSAKSFLLH